MLYSKLIITVLNFLDYFQQKKIIKLINNKFSQPITVFDVGAHYGETIKLFSNKLKLRKIYSFEASPENFKILEKKTKKYPSEKVKIYNFGLGEKISNSYINQALESSSSTINKLNEESKYFKRKLKILNVNNQNLYSHQIPIKIFTLDYFIENNEIDNIDLLKIDTEGYEFNIIKGLSRHSQNIRLVYFEHHYDDMIIKNYKFGDIHRLLNKKNFKMIHKSKMLFRKSFEYIYENQKK